MLMFVAGFGFLLSIQIKGSTLPLIERNSCKSSICELQESTHQIKENRSLTNERNNNISVKEKKLSHLQILEKVWTVLM